MLFQPAIIALLLSSALVLAMIGTSLPFALRVLRGWDISSGSERQLEMERRTYLVSTLMVLVLISELASMVLFVFNADHMAPLFVGAMCAVGTLNVDDFGFPALGLKIAVFFAAGTWLALNHLDSKGYDYPLVRVKYAALLALFPLLATSALVQLAYFQGLRADVITSCCSTLFSGNNQVTSDRLAALSPDIAMALLGLALAPTLGVGIWVLRRGRGAVLYGLLSLLSFAAGMEAVIAAVSVYVYELPHHHCPFCILKAEYGHVGYALYLPLFGAALAGLAGAVAGPAARLPSLAEAAPAMARFAVKSSMAGFALFVLVALVLIARSHLTLIEQPLAPLLLELARQPRP